MPVVKWTPHNWKLGKSIKTGFDQVKHQRWKVGKTPQPTREIIKRVSHQEMSDDAPCQAEFMAVLNAMSPSDTGSREKASQFIMEALTRDLHECLDSAKHSKPPESVTHHLIKLIKPKS